MRGIEFVGAGNPQLVNFGNTTLGVLSNGGSLTAADGEEPWQIISQPSNTYTLFGFGRYKLTDTIQASLQLNYGYFTGKGTAQSNMQTALVIKSDNAFIPASVRAAMQAGGITSFTLGTFNANNFSNYNVNDGNYFAHVGRLARARDDLQSPPVDARRLHPGRHAGRRLVLERLLPAFHGPVLCPCAGRPRSWRT